MREWIRNKCFHLAVVYVLFFLCFSPCSPPRFGLFSYFNFFFTLFKFWVYSSAFSKCIIQYECSFHVCFPRPFVSFSARFAASAAETSPWHRREQSPHNNGHSPHSSSSSSSALGRRRSHHQHHLSLSLSLALLPLPYRTLFGVVLICCSRIRLNKLSSILLSLAYVLF